jgi:hypothetical protein
VPMLTPAPDRQISRSYTDASRKGATARSAEFGWKFKNISESGSITVSNQSRVFPSCRVAADDHLIVGRLKSHGPANYQFRADQGPSYFLKVVTNRGVEVLWGKDLARALAESRAKPKLGSVIGVRRSHTPTYPELKLDGTPRQSAHFFFNQWSG